MSSTNQSSNQSSNQSAYGSSQNYENRQAPTSSQWSKPDVSYMNSAPNSAPTTSVSSQNYENRQVPTTSSQWSKPYMP